MTFSFFGERDWSTQRKPLQETDIHYHIWHEILNLSVNISCSCWLYSSFFLDLTDNQNRARYIWRFCFSISSGSLVSLFVINHSLKICVSEFVFLLVLGLFMLSTNASVSACETPTNRPSINADILQTTNDRWAELT